MEAEGRVKALGIFRYFKELEEEVTFNDTNISNYTASDLNKILMLIFGNKEKGHELYVQDNQDMNMTIIFSWIPTSAEVAIVLNTEIVIQACEY